MAKEAKTVNFGLTEETMKYLGEMQERLEKLDKGEEKEKVEKPGTKAKKDICDIVEREVQKINERLNKLGKDDAGSDEWLALMKCLDKAKDIVSYI